jgi:hypothetical protein
VTTTHRGRRAFAWSSQRLHQDVERNGEGLHFETPPARDSRRVDDACASASGVPAAPARARSIRLCQVESQQAEQSIEDLELMVVWPDRRILLGAHNQTDNRHMKDVGRLPQTVFFDQSP